ncbi:uncharacterized protein LOC135846641 [Planococcus citri]|uniref:uncharacterized protein LOC135846641 n=1 Tax=Planococcus citri TaxID=170843 RepID=UPI0031F9D085
MSQSKQQSSSFHEAEQFLSHSYSSEDEFVEKYRKFSQGNAKSKQLYLFVLIKLENSVVSGNIDTFKKYVKVINSVSDIENRETLETFYNDTQNPIKTTNLAILSCKYGRLEILKYVLGNGKLLENLSINVGKNVVTPGDKDESRHDAFYYAALSGNVELLDTLIKNWPRDYFSTRSEELDEILSKVYEELTLKNVSLSENMQVFVESQLINLRFFSNSSKQDPSSDDRVNFGDNSIRDRVDLVLEKIAFLKSEFSDVEKLDETFLFVARFIARNIHVLKRQLKFTYDRLPWEEIEFCLVSFVSSYVNRREINFFYRAILNKSKIIRYLGQFADKLEAEKSNIENERVNELADLPKLKRDQIVTDIIRNNPEFQDLYNDYRRIRDIHSLEKINEYLNLALSIDPEDRRGQLVIIRALQVIGEYLKNTLESPKLSSTTSEFLLLSLPENTRKIVFDLRNSLSHASSLLRRSEIEENADVSFFIGVQNDTKKMYDAIVDILRNRKMDMIRKLLQDIVDSESLHEFGEIVEAFGFIEVDQMSENSLKLTEHENLEKLINEMSDAISHQTYHEKNLFVRIRGIINAAENELRNTITDYNLEFAMLTSLLSSLRINVGHGLDSNHVRIQKFVIKTALQNFFPEETSSHSQKEIVELAMAIFHSAESRLQGDHLQRLMKSMLEIVHIAEFGINDIEWIANLREKLREKGAFTCAHEENQPSTTTKEKYQKQLTLKLSELKTVLKNDRVNGDESNEKTHRWKDKKFQAAVETLVLDILSILGESDNHLEENLLFLDGNSPLLVGKCLRNYLAHGNTLLDTLSDPSTAIILNAEKLVSENIAKSNRKIGKLVQHDPSNLKAKFDQDLVTVTNQCNMFTALERGDFEELKNCIAKGADIRAKSINSWSALHFASHGPSLEIVKFILDQNSDADVEDADGQNSLHVAAANGRKNIVEFFITKAGLSANSADHFRRTPLHFAAKNGHRDVVEVILLQNNDDTGNLTDLLGYAPLHYAVQRNHVEIAEILLEKFGNVDYQASAGFTPLHIAAESGRLEMVNFLLSCGANICAKHDKGATPLHLAAQNGHSEIVEALISKGADVNATNSEGGTPLHHAVELDRLEVVNILLKHGAAPSIAQKSHYGTPLHYAARDGREEIVETLLSYNADVNLVTDDGRSSPLHLAVRFGSLNVVTSLLKHGADIRAKDIDSRTPLHCAAESGCEEIAQLLIQNGAEIDSKADDNSTPLHVAALAGHKDVAAILMKNKAGVDTENKMGQTPLFLAARNGHVDICELLISQNKSVVDLKDEKGTTPLHAAARGGHENVVSFLVKSGACVNTRDKFGGTPLLEAILGNSKNVVKFLIENEAMVNTTTRSSQADTFALSPLIVAVVGGLEDIVEILVENKSDVNERTDSITPLIIAIKYNLKKIVQILITNGADVNDENSDPLLLAIRNNRTDILKILLENKANIDFKYGDGYSLLHFAVIEMCHKDIIEVLIENGIDVNGTTTLNVTPLYLASSRGHEEMAEILIRNKADVNIVNCVGTPLHIAAAKGHVNIVKLLLENGAEMLEDAEDRCLPLELAVSYSQLDAVKILLQHKPTDMNVKGNFNDWTLLHYASEKDNLEMVEYLVSKGCNIRAKSSSSEKPIHIAAREGLKDIVEFFLSKGLKVDGRGMQNKTVLHYASSKNGSQVVKFLISKGADVNVRDDVGITPLHEAVACGSKDAVAVVNILLDYGANVTHATNHGLTPLHTATWKRSTEIVNVLLQRISRNKLNEFVNAKTTSEGRTSLHIAAKNGSSDIVKSLLNHGAMYNVANKEGKTPIDLSTNQEITNLLKSIHKIFASVNKRGSVDVTSTRLKALKSDEFSAATNARNSEGNKLVQVAEANNQKNIVNVLSKMMKKTNQN